ncbi:MAG: trypsin-like peptidase domain-containing protein [Caldilineales bacterium]|nr:trypsin-like peptidase domain-containing protein [Caldilineales bacterium]
MSTQNNRRLPWLIGGALLFILLCCACIILVALAAAFFTPSSSQGRPSQIELPPRIQVTPPAIPTPRIERVLPTPLAPIEPGAAEDAETAIYTNVYERVNPSVVAVRVIDAALLDQAPDPNIQPFFFNTGEGSGFVIDTAGHIVTNRHVILGAGRVAVQFYNGIQAIAEVLGSDADTDIAVLKVDPAGLDLRPVAFGSIDDLRVGERVLVIGNPFGNSNTLTTGIISALGRDLNLPDSPFRLPEVIQTDAAINPGNSGGPMLNARGEVIGVAFMLQSSTNSNAGIGFGIPVYFVERVSRAIIAEGRYQHSWIGIRGSTLSPVLIEELGLEVQAGALVQEVIPNGPAAKAGLRGGAESRTVEGVPFLVGGDIIIAIDEQPVRVFEDLLAYLGRYGEPGREVTLTILRDDRTEQITVSLEPRPEQLDQ